jgi:hypothetical protein
MTAISTIRDDFDDNWRDQARWWVWTTSGQASIDETNQRVEVTPPAYTAGVHYAFFGSNAAGDLTGATGTVEVLAVLQGTNASTELVLQQADGQHRVLLWEGNGNLYSHEDTPGNGVSTWLAPYDPQAHRWWRIRHDATSGLLHWETSPDGRAWTSHRSAAPPFSITALHICIGAGTWDAEPAPGVAVFDNLNLPPAGVPLPDRRGQAFQVRVQAAQIAHDRPHPGHQNNREESDYPFVANYSKALPHDGCGNVDPAAYGQLLQALRSGDPAAFEAVPLGGMLKLTNPQGGLAFDLEGPDPAAVTIPPAPRIDSPQNSSEAGELYWMALARDVYFGDYASDPAVQAAIQSLNAEFSDFRGPREGGSVTPQTVFRGVYPGETAGPYVSQFLLKGTSDPRIPAGQGLCATDGFITYGALKINQRQWTVVPGMDYLTDFGTWLDVQNGWDRRGDDVIDTSQRRFIRNLRDLGERVHVDNVVDHFYNAAHILLNEVPGDQACGAGRPTVDREFRDDPGNPYSPPEPASPTETGFVTFGPPHAVTLVTEVLTRALQAVWFQKWFVHRRLRPEEFGGRVEAMLRRGCGPYPIDGEILWSLTEGLLHQHYFARFGTYLLAQQFPEGAPTHPSYGSGHATGAGACATILKAFFDDLQPIESPVVSSPDGTALVAYTGPDAGQLTVGGELNKLAGNVAIGRNSAGVHWRTDYDQSLLLGEQVALGILQEQSLRYNENRSGAYFELTTFGGQRVRIQDGAVTAV